MEEKYDIIRDNVFLSVELLEKYKNSPLPLLPEISAMQYSRGGETLHRGYYCPSLIYDIVIGGANRGKLLKRFSSLPTYCYGFDKNGYLIVSENNVIKSKEIITRNSNTEFGITIETDGLDAGKIIRISLTSFSSGKIYSYVCCDCSAESQIIDCIYGETYEYECGMLKRVYCCMPTVSSHFYNKSSKGSIDKEKIQLTKALIEFEHDANGYLKNYCFTDMNTSSSQIYQVYLKRRV